MPHAAFAIEIAAAGQFGPRGADLVQMTFSANEGEAPKPLAKVASGGELSRIALAIKAVSASRDRSVPSMVFDEIDTGIGGRTAQMVAERIALVAKYKQVLCITHLPQIASMADVHLYIAKHAQEGHTVTEVIRLTEAQEVNEIARMARAMRRRNRMARWRRGRGSRSPVHRLAFRSCLRRRLSSSVSIVIPSDA